jgi:phosphoserine phosphatase RsbU/P
MNASPISLLIVDDDPVFAQFVRQLVLSLGGELPCAPQWADSPEKAMAELDRNTYDLMLLDYNLPGADGLQVLAQIRALPPERQPAVIMLTGSGNETVAVEAMKRGARDYLLKAGLDMPALLRALRSALTQKQLADQIARYNAQTRADLEMARHLQLSLLPASYPCFPRSASPADSALRFCHRFYPASELAGDFFSVLALSDTQAGVFICDVMGHGVRSALVTAMIRALVDDAALRTADPGQFLCEINRRLAGLLKPADGPMFATAFYLVADAANGWLRYATAGHPPPLHLQRHAGLIAPLRVSPHGGPALGFFGDTTYATGECPLAADDVILLFTDGLFEVTSADGEEEYGQERLLDAARQHLNLSPLELCDALIAGVRTFAGGAALSDDVCLLSVEIARLQAGCAGTIDERKEALP